MLDSLNFDSCVWSFCSASSSLCLRRSSRCSCCSLASFSAASNFNRFSSCSFCCSAEILFFLLLLVFYSSHFTMRRPCNSHSHDEIYLSEGRHGKMGRDTHRCLVGCLEEFRSRNTEGTTTAGAATRFRANTSYLTAAKASRKHVIWLWRFHTDCVKFFKIHQRRPDRLTYCMQFLF